MSIKHKVEVDVQKVVKILTTLSATEKEVALQHGALYSMFGGVEGEVQNITTQALEISYTMLEMLGLDKNMLYDWVHCDGDFEIFHGDKVFNMYNAEDYVMWELGLKDILDFDVCRFVK